MIAVFVAGMRPVDAVIETIGAALLAGVELAGALIDPLLLAIVALVICMTIVVVVAIVAGVGVLQRLN